MKAYARKTVADHLDLTVKSGTVRLLGQDPSMRRCTLFPRIGVQFQEGDHQKKEIKVSVLCKETASLYRR